MYARLRWNILDCCALCIVLRVMKLHHALVLMGWSPYIGEFFSQARSRRLVQVSSTLCIMHDQSSTFYYSIPEVLSICSG